MPVEGLELWGKPRLTNPVPGDEGGDYEGKGEDVEDERGGGEDNLVESSGHGGNMNMDDGRNSPYIVGNGSLD